MSNIHKHIISKSESKTIFGNYEAPHNMFLVSELAGSTIDPTDPILDRGTDRTRTDQTDMMGRAGA